jgi:uncharacterized protein YjiS (DUF1127 family)
MRLLFGYETLPAARGAPPAAESRPRVHAEIEDWAMRAAARNGFGGEMPRPAVLPRGRAGATDHAAPAGMRPETARLKRRVVAVLRLLARRMRQAAALRRLQSLDAAALRDLGLDRSELGSVHAEVYGRAAPTRRLVVEHEWFRLRAGSCGAMDAALNVAPSVLPRSTPEQALIYP